MKNFQVTPDCYHESGSCNNSDLTLPYQQDTLRNMNMQTCPYCKEKIYSNALVCRYCKRDLPDMATVQRGGESNWLPALLASALIVTGAAFFAYGFFKERRNWVDRE